MNAPTPHTPAHSLASPFPDLAHESLPLRLELPEGPISSGLPMKLVTIEEVPAHMQPPRSDSSIGVLVNGERKPWSGPSCPIPSGIALRDGDSVVYPTVGQYPLQSRVDAEAALKSATQTYDHGLGAWPQSSAEERIACMEKFLTLIEPHRDEIVRGLVWEIAKTVPQAESEFDRTIAYMRETIAEYRRIEAAGADTQQFGAISAQISPAPRGVVLCVGPSNYPLNETLTVLLPAILVGNTAICKAPKMGIGPFGPVLDALHEAFPPGIVNFLSGDGQELLSPLMKSGEIDVLAFIGSTRVARTLIEQHPAPYRLHLVLGLGAKNPAIVLPDADLDYASSEIALGALGYNGQRCTALKNVFVHADVAEPFAALLAEKIQALKIGMPWEPKVSGTPLAEPGKVGKMQALVEDARALGATILNHNGGAAIENMMVPAVLFPVDSRMRIFHEEQFGPIVPVAIYHETPNLLRTIAESPYSQQVSVFTGNPNSAEVQELERAMKPLAARGNLNMQCQRGPDQLPFTGRKDSATGTLSIHDALTEFSVPYVSARKVV